MTARNEKISFLYNGHIHKYQSDSLDTAFSSIIITSTIKYYWPNIRDS